MRARPAARKNVARNPAVIAAGEAAAATTPPPAPTTAAVHSAPGRTLAQHPAQIARQRPQSAQQSIMLAGCRLVQGIAVRRVEQPGAKAEQHEHGDDLPDRSVDRHRCEREHPDYLERHAARGEPARAEAIR